MTHYERLMRVSGATTQGELALMLGERQNTVANWKMRGSVPLPKLLRASKILAVRFEWLLTGEGELRMWPDVERRKGVSIHLDPEAIRLLAAWQQGSDDMKHAIVCMVEALVTNQGKLPNSKRSRRLSDSSHATVQ